MEKKKNNSVKLVIASVAIVIAALIIAQVAYALFSDKDSENLSIKTAKINVNLSEDPEWVENTDEYGIEKYTKVVKGVSTEKVDAYVRIKCIPIVQYYKEGEENATGEWITNATPQEDILVTIESDDWVQDGEYWYYKYILKGFEETTPLNINWTVLELPAELSTKQLRTDVRVVLEYAQAENNVWKEAFQLDELPDSVEK